MRRLSKEKLRQAVLSALKEHTRGHIDAGVSERAYSDVADQILSNIDFADETQLAKSLSDHKIRRLANLVLSLDKQIDEFEREFEDDSCLDNNAERNGYFSYRPSPESVDWIQRRLDKRHDFALRLATEVLGYANTESPAKHSDVSDEMEARVTKLYLKPYGHYDDVDISEESQMSHEEVIHFAIAVVNELQLTETRTREMVVTRTSDKDRSLSLLKQVDQIIRDTHPADNHVLRAIALLEGRSFDTLAAENERLKEQLNDRELKAQEFQKIACEQAERIATLEKVIEQSETHDLPVLGGSVISPEPGETVVTCSGKTMDNISAQLIRNALQKARGVVGDAAKLLEISTKRFYGLMKEYDIKYTRATAKASDADAEFGAAIKNAMVKIGASSPRFVPEIIESARLRYATLAAQNDHLLERAEHYRKVCIETEDKLEANIKSLVAENEKLKLELETEVDNRRALEKATIESHSFPEHFSLEEICMFLSSRIAELEAELGPPGSTQEWSDGYSVGWKDQAQKIAELEGVLNLKKDEYVQQIGTWKVIQRLEEQVAELTTILKKIRSDIFYCLGPTRDVKTPVLQDMLATLDAVLAKGDK